MVKSAFQYANKEKKKDPPSNARDVGLTAGWGSRIPYAVGQLSPHATTREKPTHLREDPVQPKIEIQDFVLVKSNIIQFECRGRRFKSRSESKNQECQHLRAGEDICPSSSRGPIHPPLTFFFFFLFNLLMDWEKLTCAGEGKIHYFVY